MLEAAAEAYTALLERGPSVLILTRGGERATGFLADRSVVQVNAGDTFNTGFLAKLYELQCLAGPQLETMSADTLQQAMKCGAKVAAVTVSRAGANPP